MDWIGIDLRRLGTGLVAFGVTGMLIAGIVAVGLIAGAVAARNLDDRLATEQAQLVAALDRVDATMAQTVTTIDNAGATLTTTSGTLTQAATTLDKVASTAEELSTSLDFAILGNRPLAGAAARFGELAVEVRAFEDKASQLADNLGTNATDVGGLATQIDLLRDEVASLSGRVAAFEATGELVALLIGGILLLALLVAWLAVAGAGCAWMGLRLRRLGAPGAQASKASEA
jgi:HAMP domain-containing protein